MSSYHKEIFNCEKCQCDVLYSHIVVACEIPLYVHHCKNCQKEYLIDSIYPKIITKGIK